MRHSTETKLTPQQRLTRGLSHTASGPVDVSRGLVGLGVKSARIGAVNLQRRYQESQLARDVAAAQETIAREVAAAPDALAREVSAAQEVIAGLPEALQQARTRQQRRRRRWLVAGAAALLGGGAAAVVIIRRSSRQEEPSPLPPSVEVQPKP